MYVHIIIIVATCGVGTDKLLRVQSVVSTYLPFPEYAVSSARLATIQDTIRETSCPASDTYVRGTTRVKNVPSQEKDGKFIVRSNIY